MRNMHGYLSVFIIHECYPLIRILDKNPRPNSRMPFGSGINKLFLRLLLADDLKLGGLPIPPMAECGYEDKLI